MFISGRHTTCADQACSSPAVVLDRETFIGRAYDGPMIVGEEHCTRCGCRMAFSRRLTRAEIAAGVYHHLQRVFTREVDHEVEWP
jgi:hypothetical protein